MRKSIIIPLSFVPALCASAIEPQQIKNESKMNIVLILADDLGWGDVGYHGSEIQTPNLDQLAQEDIILDRFYTAPVSSPTRAGLMTGRYPNRFGIRETVIPPWRDFGLDPEEETLADILGQAGYPNRTIVGKWHLGHLRTEYYPLNRGFTHFYGHLNGALDYFTHKRDGQLDWHNDWESSYDTGYSTDLLTAESVKCINEYSQSDEPFFLYLAYNAPHGPLQAKNEDIALYTDNYNALTPEQQRRVTFSAMVTCMDRGIGEIRQALKDNGVEDNTLFIFFSDNGADPNIGGSNIPLRGNKFQEFDGGVRTPAIISYPAKWIGGRTINQVVGFVDIMPTIRSLLDMEGSPKRPYDGLDISSLLSGETQTLVRDLYLGCGAVVNNDYKFVLKGKNNKMNIANNFLSYYPEQSYEEKNLHNKSEHQSEYQRLLKIAQHFDSIESPFILPPYGEGKEGFIPPFEWNVNLYQQVNVIYVAPDGTGSGSSWENAASFNTASETARSQGGQNQLWIKQGIYEFTSSANFDNLFIYGGFKGNEIELNERNWAVNSTISDGKNICSPLRNTIADNRPGGNATRIPCLLDGVTIQNGISPSDANGGGMIINNGAVIKNCIFKNNFSQNGKNGGAIHCHTNECLIQNSLFINNTSSGNGGAIQVGGGTTTTIVNCTFANNKSEGIGGAIGTGANTSNVKLINSIAFNNLNSNNVYESYGQNSNINGGGSIISNHSAVESTSSKFTDGDDTEHIQLTKNYAPDFKSPSSTIGKGQTEAEIADINNASYMLSESSVCINSGNNDEAEELDYDLSHKSRIWDNTIDIGAYEYFPVSGNETILNKTSSIRVTISNSYLKINGIEKGRTVQLFDIDGRLIHSKKATDKNIPVELYLHKKGVFLVKSDSKITKVVF